jgi:dienelactone hydrolase
MIRSLLLASSLSVLTACTAAPSAPIQTNPTAATTALRAEAGPGPAQQADASVRIAYLSYPVTTSKGVIQVAGVLRVPRDGKAPMPAVLVVHGSAGVDGRGQALAVELNRAGIATFEIDMWTPRGVKSPLERPAHVSETLPDVYAAFHLLSANAAIDKQRIGITGFSWGGVVSMLTATRKVSEQYLGRDARFAAHAPHYPVCFLYNRVPGYEFRDLTGARVLLQAGEWDDYDQPDTCPKLIASLPDADRALVRATVYEQATHGWDGGGPATSHVDPAAHLGKGGDFRLIPNAAIAQRSRAAATAFFRCSFGMGGCGEIESAPR